MPQPLRGLRLGVDEVGDNPGSCRRSAIPSAFERSRCRGGRFAWFDRAIAMSQNKIGVSRKMSIEYPYKQLPCQTQGWLPSNGPIRSDPALKILLRPWSFLRRVTPDRVLAFIVPYVRPPIERSSEKAGRRRFDSVLGHHAIPCTKRRWRKAKTLGDVCCDGFQNFRN